MDCQAAGEAQSRQATTSSYPVYNVHNNFFNQIIKCALFEHCLKHDMLSAIHKLLHNNDGLAIVLQCNQIEQVDQTNANCQLVQMILPINPLSRVGGNLGELVLCAVVKQFAEQLQMTSDAINSLTVETISLDDIKIHWSRRTLNLIIAGFASLVNQYKSLLIQDLDTPKNSKIIFALFYKLKALKVLSFLLESMSTAFYKSLLDETFKWKVPCEVDQSVDELHKQYEKFFAERLASPASLNFYLTSGRYFTDLKQVLVFVSKNLPSLINLIKRNIHLTQIEFLIESRSQIKTEELTKMHPTLRSFVEVILNESDVFSNENLVIRYIDYLNESQASLYYQS